MFFDYLDVIVAAKLAETDRLEILKFFEISKKNWKKQKWNFFHFLIFFVCFKLIDLSEFGSYNDIQVVKKHLLFMNFTNQKFFTPLTSFLPPFEALEFMVKFENFVFFPIRLAFKSRRGVKN